MRMARYCYGRRGGGDSSSGDGPGSAARWVEGRSLPGPPQVRQAQRRLSSVAFPLTGASWRRRNDRTVQLWEMAGWSVAAAFDWEVGPLLSLAVAQVDVPHHDPPVSAAALPAQRLGSILRA